MTANGPTPGLPGPYGQQPQGYGYPQHPVPQQQAYGFPPQPQQAVAPYPGHGYGSPLPHTPPRKKKTGLILTLVLALIVLVGVGGGATAWYLLRDTAPQPLWSVKTNASSGLVQEVQGTWFTDKSVVQTESDAVKAYDLNSGSQLWATALPGAGSNACIAPPESFGGIGIVAYGGKSARTGSGHACDHIAAYDLTSGKVLWHQNLNFDMAAKDVIPESRESVSVSRAGDTVVVRTNKETKALKAADGSRAWDPQQAAVGGCDVGVYTGGENLIRIQGCRSGRDSNEKVWHAESLIDPATGKAKWTTREGAQGSMSTVSTSPIVFSTAYGSYAVDEARGVRRGMFPSLTEQRINGFTEHPYGSNWPDVAGFANVFVMGAASEGHLEDGYVTAFDLDSGRQIWKTKAQPHTQYIPLSGTGGTRILVYVKTDDAAKLVEMGKYDGSMKTLVEYPESVNKSMSLGAWPHWRDGRIYVTGVGGSFADTSHSLMVLPTTE